MKINEYRNTIVVILLAVLPLLLTHEADVHNDDNEDLSVEVNNSITSFSILSSTHTTLYARWTVMLMNSSDIIEGYKFRFRSKTGELFVYKIRNISVIVYQDQVDNTFEYNFTDIQNSQSYRLKATVVTNRSSSISTFSLVPAGAPLNIMSLTTSSTTIQLYWFLPDTTGEIFTYTLIYTGFPFDTTQKSEVVNVEDNSTTTTGIQGPFNLVGLEEFNKYTIRVRASNGLGDGLSEEVTQQTAQAAPNGPPLNITAESINSTSLFLSWYPPNELDQNGFITSYNISVSSLGLNTFLNYSVPPEIYPAVIRYTLIVTRLQIYTEYSVIITAVNSVGSGNMSLPVNTATLSAAPTAPPQNITAYPIQSTKIQITFLPPPTVAQNGLIVFYRVVVRGNPLDTTEQTRDIYVMFEYPATSLIDAILIGLEENNNYTLAIFAVSEEGEGPLSEEIYITTGIGAPDLPPQNLTAQPLSSSSILFTWSPPPLLNQNGPIISYNLTYRGVIYDTDLRIIVIDVNETNNQLTQQIVIRRLTAYTNYTIGVSVATVNGSSTFSYIRQRTNESVPSSPPENLFFTGVSATEVQIHWSYPVISHQNGVITHYVISYTSSLFSYLSTVVSHTVTNPSFPDTNTYYQNIAGLQEYVSYKFNVSASTAIGIGPSSSEEVIKTLQAVPNPPILVDVTLNATFVTIIWNPPLEIEQNGPITTYRICYKDSSSNAIKNVIIYQVPAPIVYPANSSVSMNETFPVELNVDLYTWYITAENAAGISAGSNTISERVVRNIDIFIIIGVSSCLGCLLLCCLVLLLVHFIAFMILCCRRYSDRKMKKIETTTVEMKTRTIFSNRSSLKELEESEARKEAIYAMIGKNQFPGASAAKDTLEVVVVNPIEAPQLEVRRESIMSTLERESSLIHESGPKGDTSLEQPNSKKDESNYDTLRDVTRSMEDSLKEAKDKSLVETKEIDLEKTEWEEGELPAPPPELAQMELSDVSYHPYDNFPDKAPN